MRFYAFYQHMPLVSHCCGKEIDVTTVLQFEFLVQLIGSGREVAHGDVGLPYIAEHAAQVILAKAARIHHLEAASGVRVFPFVAGVQMAVAMQFKETVLLSHFVLHSRLEHRGIGLV